MRRAAIVLSLTGVGLVVLLVLLLALAPRITSRAIPTTGAASRCLTGTENRARPLGQALAAPQGGRVVLPAGVDRFRDFTPNPDSTVNGVDVPLDVHSVVGAGEGRTVLEMVAGTSTRAGLVPTVTPATNQLSLLRFSSTPLTLRDFTVCGTEQGHLYNGLRISRVTGADVRDIDVRGVPGNDYKPPGETFGINDYHTVGSRYTDVTVDGETVGASGFGANYSQDLQLIRCRFVRSGSAIGATFFRSNGVRIVDARVSGNANTGLNFEQMSGSVEMIRPRFGKNGTHDIQIANDLGAEYRIVDPSFQGPRLVIMVPRSSGQPLGSTLNIHVLVHGQDRTAEVAHFIPG